MTTVTLDDIKTQHSKLTEMIAAYEKSAVTTRVITVAEAAIALQPGERYAGLMLDKHGAPSHHLILLPPSRENITWNDAIAWAKEVGGELPTRREQSLLFANLKSAFNAAWYWSCEQHESDGSFAWSQDFDDGFQSSGHKSDEFSARAVRRLKA